MTTTMRTPDVRAPAAARGRWSLAALRWVSVLHVVALFAQPVFAGRFLTGDYDMLALHTLGANIVFTVGLVQLGCALLLWLRGGPRWAVGAAAGLAAGETAQYFAGLDGALDLHLPLGVALIVLGVLSAVAVFRAQPLRCAERRGERR